MRLTVLSSTALAAALVLALPLVARADSEPPLIRHTPVAKANRGEAVTVTAQMEDKDEIFAPTFYYRYAGARGYSPVPMLKRGDAFVATVPATSDFEYWIEAYDEYGNGPSREGSPDRPHRVAVAERAPSAPRAAAAAPVAKEPLAAAPGGAAVADAPEPPAPPVPELDEAPAAVATRPEVPAEALVGAEELGGEKPIYKQWWFLGTAAGVAAVATVAIVIVAQPDPVYRNSFNASFKRP